MYPPLPMYVLNLVVDVYEAFAHPLILNVPRDEVTFMVLGRAISAAFGTATIPLVYLIASRVAGRLAGVLAALLLACSVLHLRDSHFFTTDSSLVVFQHADVAVPHSHGPARGCESRCRRRVLVRAGGAVEVHGGVPGAADRPRPSVVTEAAAAPSPARSLGSLSDPRRPADRRRHHRLPDPRSAGPHLLRQVPDGLPRSDHDAAARRLAAAVLFAVCGRPAARLLVHESPVVRDGAGVRDLGADRRGVAVRPA